MTILPSRKPLQQKAAPRVETAFGQGGAMRTWLAIVVAIIISLVLVSVGMILFRMTGVQAVLAYIAVAMLSYIVISRK